MPKESSAVSIPTKDKIFAHKNAGCYVVGVLNDGASPKKTSGTEEVENQGGNDNDLDKKPAVKLGEGVESSGDDNSDDNKINDQADDNAGYNMDEITKMMGVYQPPSWYYYTDGKKKGQLNPEKALMAPP
jgi:hypothetical protein